MAAGGPMSLFWGFVVISPFVMCIALSMAEVFSGIMLHLVCMRCIITRRHFSFSAAYPVNGGVYSWCYLLSSPEWGPSTFNHYTR